MYIAKMSLMGLGASDANVVQLQQALMGLALKTGNPGINPGPATGELNAQTMTAMQQALSVISSSLPSGVYLALQGAFLAGSSSSTVKGYVQQYAVQLAMAVNVAASKLGTSATVPATTLPIAIATPWYRQTWGMVAIGLGIFGVGWYLFVREPDAKAA